MRDEQIARLSRLVDEVAEGHASVRRIADPPKLWSLDRSKGRVTVGVRSKSGCNYHFNAGLVTKRGRELQFAAVCVAGAGKHLSCELAIRGDYSVDARAVWAAVFLRGNDGLETLCAQGARPQVDWDRACICRGADHSGCWWLNVCFGRVVVR